MAGVGGAGPGAPPSDSKNVPYNTVLVKYRYVVICTVESAPFFVSMYRPHFRSAPFFDFLGEKGGVAPRPLNPGA